MALIPTSKKRQLSDLLALGHRRFGNVLPRRPYLEEDDEDRGGEGEVALRFKGHPLLANMPDGAASDLTFMVQQNKNSIRAAEERINQACQQLKYQHALRYGYKKAARPVYELPRLTPSGS